MINIRVKWRNPRSKYLANAQCGFTPVAGSPSIRQTAGPPAQDFFEFEAQANAGDKIEMKLSFNPQLTGARTNTNVTARVFDVSQVFSIQSQNGPISEDSPKSTLLGPLRTSSNSNDFNEITALTDFVDLTDVFFSTAGAFCNPARFAEVRRPTQPWKVFALGFTGSQKPNLWFAVIPDHSVDIDGVPGDGLPAFLYYRHENAHYQDIESSLVVNFAFEISRIILPPPPVVSRPPTPSTDPDYFFHAFNRSAGRTEPPPLDRVSLGPAGFGPALVASKCHLVMLLPWPDFVDYGVAQTADLPRTVENALILLHAKGLVAKKKASIKLGRLALGAFSSSGRQVNAAMQANGNNIHEVYWFDADYDPGFGQSATLNWVNSGSPTKRLRLNCGGIGGNNNVANKNIAALTADRQRVVIYPPNGDNSFWDPAGANPWYDQMMTAAEAAKPGIRSIVDTENEISSRHHFCLVGGDGDFDSNQGRGRTFLEQFLTDSGFPRVSMAHAPQYAAPPKPWPGWPASFAHGARGALILDNPAGPSGTKPPRAYFFKGLRNQSNQLIGHYIGIDIATKTLATGDAYPALVSASWENWPKQWGDSPIDACVCFHKAKGSGRPMAYFFKSDEYIRYDPNAAPAGKVVSDPKKIKGGPDEWNGLPAAFGRDLDAVIEWDLTTAYFFKGGKVVKYNIELDTLASGPELISVWWPNMPASFRHSIHAAAVWTGHPVSSDQTVYFFNGNQYVEYISPTGAARGYPRTILVP